MGKLLTPAYRDGRTVTAHWLRRGRIVPQGTELSLKGTRGRWRLRGHVVLADGREWLELVSPTHGYLAVTPERVRVVHRKGVLRPAARAARTVSA